MRIRLPLLLATALMVFAQSGGNESLAYKTGYSSIMKLGRDVHSALPPKYREIISQQPISIETDPSPYIRLLYLPEGPSASRGVWISAGFIDLVNRVAHATAIGVKDKNYLKRYIEILARESGTEDLRPLPDDDNPRYWTDEMLNEQQSNFNSIVGIIVAIELSHHYLGHYEKYKNKLTRADGKHVPISSLLTEDEWEESFRAGVRNALGAGCMIERVIPFFVAFEKMKTRPPWAAFFLPEKFKFSKMRREMEKIQKKFLEQAD